MVTHLEGSTLYNLEIQFILVHKSVNVFFFSLLVLKILSFLPNKMWLWEVYYTVLFKRNMLLRLAEFLLRLKVRILCRQRWVFFDISIVMIFNFRIKKPLEPKKAQRQRFWGISWLRPMSDVSLTWKIITSRWVEFKNVWKH